MLSRVLVGAILAISLMAASVSADVFDASFDCKKASSDIEKIICSDESLAQLDKQLASRYKDFIAQLPEAKRPIATKMQRIWLKDRLTNCGEYLIACVRNRYEGWIRVIDDGVFIVSKELKQFEKLADPEDADLTWTLHFFHDTDSLKKDVLIYTAIASNNDNSEAVVTGKVRQNRWNYPDRIYFFLTKSGNFFRAIGSREGAAPQFCKNSARTTLNFLAIDGMSTIGDVVISEGSYDCEEAVSGVQQYAEDSAGNLNIYFKKNNKFYDYYLFPEMRASVVDKKNKKVSTNAFIDYSKTHFLDKEYKALFKSIADRESYYMSLDGQNSDPSCHLKGSEGYLYASLKIDLAGQGIGLEQLQFIANNVLNKQHLSELSQYKYLIDAALDYLDKARSTPDWQVKLTRAAKKFPDVVFEEGYEYAFAPPNDKEPFTEEGFYTDSTCFAKAGSSLVGASFEEWIYLFWYRRLMDGNLNMAEAILRNAQNLMTH